MNCRPAFSSDFLVGLVDYLDCEGRAFGAFGYFGLSSSASLIALLSVALSLAIAFFGVRLLLGRDTGLQHILELTLRIGIVLSLFFSWGAVKPIFHDGFFGAPAEIAGAVSSAGSSDIAENLLQRYQAVDDGIVYLSSVGTGRDQLAATRLPEGGQAAPAFAGNVVSDELALGTARYALLLTAALGLGGLKLVGGILLAMLPLFAILLLFRATQAAAFGWVKAFAGIGLAFLLFLLLGTSQLALMEPWLARAIDLRQNATALPSAPIELLLQTSLFAFVLALGMFFLAKAVFAPALSVTFQSARQQFEQLSSRDSQLHSRSSSLTERGNSREERLASFMRETGGPTAVTPGPGGRAPREAATEASVGRDSSFTDRHRDSRSTRTAQKRDRR